MKSPAYIAGYYLKMAQYMNQQGSVRQPGRGTKFEPTYNAHESKGSDPTIEQHASLFSPHRVDKTYAGRVKEKKLIDRSVDPRPTTAMIESNI